VEKLHKNNRLFLLVEKFSSVDLHPDVVDNHAMGQIFEELLRKFSEMSNETSGEHYTPRDIVKLLVSLVFSGDREDLQGKGKIRSVFDPCCGTGGMLTIGKDWVLENINPQIEIKIYGQELNPQTYSICKSDLLISGENPDHIRLGSSLGEDGFTGEKFDYMITNPPFGVSWKSEEEFVTAEAQNPNGRFFAGTPRTSDGSLLFLQHMIVFLTGITTYIWILNNNKKAQRKGKVQLINACGLFKPMKKSLGSKRKEICSEQQQLILERQFKARHLSFVRYFWIPFKLLYTFTAVIDILAFYYCFLSLILRHIFNGCLYALSSAITGIDMNRLKRKDEYVMQVCLF